THLHQRLALERYQREVHRRVLWNLTRDDRKALWAVPAHRRSGAARAQPAGTGDSPVSNGKSRIYAGNFGPAAETRRTGCALETSTNTGVCASCEDSSGGGPIPPASTLLGGDLPHTFASPGPAAHSARARNVSVPGRSAGAILPPRRRAPARP